jgi:hypothetical protein
MHVVLETKATEALRAEPYERAEKRDATGTASHRGQSSFHHGARRIGENPVPKKMIKIIII